MISLQTNVTSLDAQNNLNTDNLAQGKTIQQLSSGYRINSSGDDAAGLAVANQYRDNIAELTQGVSNASTGIAQLQIVDGGLSNISTIMDRMKTLATESVSGTFTGSRATLDNEYQGLISEITRQATNVNLNAGGSFNSNLNVYIGGATTQADASVTINLSGTSNAVDAASLGLSTTSVQGGGSSFGGSSATNLNDPNALFNVSPSSSNYEQFAITYLDSSGAITTKNVQVDASTSGVSGATFVSQLNSQIAAGGITGISAQIGSDGTLQLTGGNLLAATTSVSGTAPTQLAATSGETLINSANYQSSGAFAAVTAGTETVTVAAGGQNYSISLSTANGDTQAHALTAINTALKGSGVYAVDDGTGTNIVLQSATTFTVSETAAATGGWYAAVGAQTVTAPNQSTTATGNAALAITAINAAIQTLGLVQGRVGAGENLLQYATNLANSQITNFSTAQSGIRDADVAADASKLTQGQVLEQTAVAAMAQANSSAQVVLKLLQ
ncbi:MAG TPA: flagellin [Bryobacteraceae bacterium]